MPKFSVLTWGVILIAQITYGLLVFAITRSYYQDPQPMANQVPSAAPEVSPQPQAGSFNANLQPAMNIRPSAEELATDDPVLIVSLADNYFQQKEYQSAIELYQRALQIDPEDVESYNDLGLSLFYIGETNRALEALRKGAAKQPGFQRIQLTLGFVQAQTGDKEAAAAAFRKAIELDPQNRVGEEAKRMLAEIE
jgi:tetratricopeptide (TPR) repeat protein